MKSEEEKVKKYLKRWLEKEKNRMVSPMEIQLPGMKYGRNALRPDIFAYKPRANLIHLIECKKAKPRLVGHAFGQMMTTMISIQKMPKRELEEKLENTKPNLDINKLKIEFGVAFYRPKVNRYKSIKKTIYLLHRLRVFRNLAIYLVDRHNTSKFKGKPIPYSKLRRGILE